MSRQQIRESSGIERGGGRRIARAATLAGAVILGMAACGDSAPQGEGASAPRPMLAERPSFDGDAAFDHVLTQVDFGPRIPGSQGHAAQAQWMVDRLQEWADTVVTQEFTWTTTGGETLELVNVMGRFLPEREHRILLVAHWDTRPKADQADTPEEREMPVPGANDGASGVAVLLELARMMSGQPPATGIDILFVDGEDYGPGTEDMFLGARHFAQNPVQGPRQRFGVLLDMVGDADPTFPIEGYSAQRAPQVARRVWDLAARLGYSRWFPMETGGYVNDDHIPLNDAGIPTIDIIDMNYSRPGGYWHTPDDTPENLSPTTLRMVGEVVAELVYQGY